MSTAGISRSFVMLLAAGLLLPVAGAQTPSHDLSVASGVYTREQAQQGKAAYDGKCGMCHGDDLQGLGQNPALAGSAFLNRWAGETVADLFAKTIVMMPATAPGTMSPQETAAIMAYILSVNRFPPGKTELPSTQRALEKIAIVHP